MVFGFLSRLAYKSNFYVNLQCNVVNGCAYKVLGKDLCIKEGDVYAVLAWIIRIAELK